MDQKSSDKPVVAPTRRNVIKTGTTAALALAASPAALAAARTRFPASGDIVLTFEVTPNAGLPEASDLS